MSKKSYKRHQNRLYREIHRRILAENMLLKPMKFSTCERKVETLKVRSIVPNYMINETEFIKADMARRMTNKLIADNYVVFFTNGSFAYDSQEVEARLDVVKPMTL